MRIVQLLILALLAMAPSNPTYAGAVLNNLNQIGLASHDDNVNNLKQIAIAVRGTIIGYTGDTSISCSDGSVRTFSDDPTVVCGDGSVRTVGGNNAVACSDGSVRTVSGADGVVCGDGSVRYVGGGLERFISVDQGAGASLCFSNVHVLGGITDGTSNTIQFGEHVGLGVVPGFIAPHTSVQQIQDGTSNTILFGEAPDRGFCIGNTAIGDPLVGSIGDGTSNTILLGDNSSFDVCFSQARFGTVSDGTSNTLLFGEAQSGICLNDVQVGTDISVAGAVPEPGTIVLWLLVLSAIYARAWRRSQASLTKGRARSCVIASSMAAP